MNTNIKQAVEGFSLNGNVEGGVLWYADYYNWPEDISENAASSLGPVIVS